MSTEYKIFVTPLLSAGVYGEEVEVSDWLIAEDISEIIRAIDSADYEIGVYAYNDVTLTFDASDGYLLNQNDSRSLFTYSRDQAKVRIVYHGAPVPRNRYAYFPGLHKSIDLGASFAPDWDDPWTVSAWVNFDSPTSSFEFQNFAGSVGVGVSIEGDSGDGALAITAGDANAIRVTFTAALSGWQHVVFRYDGSGVAAGVFVDIGGVSQVLTVVDDTLGGLTTISGNSAVLHCENGTLVDTMGIYTAMLTNPQLAANTAAGRAADLSSLSSAGTLAHLYNFDGNANDQVGGINGEEIGAVEYLVSDVQYPPSFVSTLTTFRGLINEAASKIDPEAETVSVVVQSYDSILKRTLVPAGGVPSGASFKNALIAILNYASSTLTVNALNINPAYDGTVDIGSAFDNKSAKDALDALLLPCNSILIVDETLTVYVKSRAESSNPVLYLYGKGDLLGRENMRLLSYNDGLHRCFNLIRVKGAQKTIDVGGQSVSQPALVGVAQDATSIVYYGFRLKELTLDFVTEQATLDAIAAAILVEFRYPKPEAEVEVATELVQGQSPATDLLDRVSLNYPLCVRPLPGKRLPVIGITSIGDTTAPLPFVSGAVSIDEAIAWKVIELRESPSDFTTVLKLRVKGSGLNDQFF